MMLTPSADQLLAFRRAVEDASARPDVPAAVHAVYEAVQDAIDLRRPRCDASGRCCNFDAYGHRLYVTTAELGTFLHDLGQRPVERAAAGGGRFPSPGCAYQKSGLCSVHAVRPFGCRMFFCDPTAGEWQQESYERFHSHLKDLHARLSVPYYYMEWRQALRAVGEG